MRSQVAYVKAHPWQTAFRVIRWMPFVLAAAFIYFLAGCLGMVPTSWNCSYFNSRTVSQLGINFDISSADCLLGPFYSEMPTAIRASQPGEWFKTKIFEDVGGGEVEIDVIDAHTIRIATLALSAQKPPEFNTHDIRIQRSKWRDVRFVYELAVPDGRPE